MNKVYGIFRYLPDEISAALRKSDGEILSGITDLRLRTDCPVTAYSRGRLYYLTEKGLSPSPALCTTLFSQGAEQILMRICKNSLYAYEESIKTGFVTTEGGHRVGITGTAAVENGKIASVRDIRGFYFRIARDVKGCADEVSSLLTDGYGRPLNTLIVSPPGQGKTTLLRDCARHLSELGFRVCVVDERSEIAMGDPKVLPLCAVLDGYPKGEGITAALRSMSPEVTVVDEIGGEEDIFRLRSGIWAGTALLATAHARNISELYMRAGFSELIPYFDLCLMPRMREGRFTCGYEILKAEARV